MIAAERHRHVSGRRLWTSAGLGTRKTLFSQAYYVYIIYSFGLAGLAFFSKEKSSSDIRERLISFVAILRIQEKAY